MKLVIDTFHPGVNYNILARTLLQAGAKLIDSDNEDRDIIAVIPAGGFPAMYKDKIKELLKDADYKIIK